jgi:thiol-disulfide isomerase/thioredoxin
MRPGAWTANPKAYRSGGLPPVAAGVAFEAFLPATQRCVRHAPGSQTKQQIVSISIGKEPPAHRGRRTLRVTLIGVALLAGIGSPASEPVVIKLADGTQVATTIYPSAGDNLMLWLPTGYGLQQGETRVATELARTGVEVWQPQLLQAHFLPALESSLQQIPAKDVAEFIDRAHQVTGKSVYLLGAARAALLALRGAQAWRAEHLHGTALAGAVLLHPNLLVGPPTPGKKAVYDGLARQTRLPIFIIQPTLSPWHWYLGQTQAVLESGGSKVYARPVAGVRDRFYFRPDATVQEEHETENLPLYLHQAISQLARAQIPERPSTATTTTAQAVIGKRGLNPYMADPEPPTLTLPDLNGRMHDLGDYRGRVVLVNFWASWCPPCVHELPSLQRLKNKLSDRPFTILAVNMAEQRKTVRAFLRDKMHTDFTVLLDADGEILKRWKVFVFPTSFVIGPDGKIRYGAYGELLWDEEPTAGIIEGLLPRN